MLSMAKAVSLANANAADIKLNWVSLSLSLSLCLSLSLSLSLSLLFLSVSMSLSVSLPLSLSLSLSVSLFLCGSLSLSFSYPLQRSLGRLFMVYTPAYLQLSVLFLMSIIMYGILCISVTSLLHYLFRLFHHSVSTVSTTTLSRWSSFDWIHSHLLPSTPLASLNKIDTHPKSRPPTTPPPQNVDARPYHRLGLSPAGTLTRTRPNG